MSRSRSQSDGSAASFIGTLIVVAVLWWLRWVILAALLITAVVMSTRWFLRRRAQHRAAALAHIDAIKSRADIQNTQILRGDPAGFFGQYPIPDPELIPTWFTMR